MSGQVWGMFVPQHTLTNADHVAHLRACPLLEAPGRESRGGGAMFELTQPLSLAWTHSASSLRRERLSSRARRGPQSHLDSLLALNWQE